MELRKDYLLNRWTIISEKRGKRPHQVKQTTKTTKTDYFALGNENLTPKEEGRIEKNGIWQMRWFSNKFPATSKKGNNKIEKHNEYYTFSTAYGDHLVLVELQDGKKQLWDLEEKEIEQLFKVYGKLIKELEKDEKIKYVNVFKNHGVKGGTSIIHSHSQIISLNITPPLVQEKLDAIKKLGKEPYKEIIEKEKNSDRRCFENNKFIAFTPYASRFNHEIWLFPKKHLTRFEEFEDEDYKAMTNIMKKILTKLKELAASYNYYIHYSPKGKNLRWHLVVCPRIQTWAGFELGTRCYINETSPEKAAEFYRT